MVDKRQGVIRIRSLLLIVLATYVPRLAAQPISGTLNKGDIFPKFTGQTLTGKSVELPLTSKPAMVIFSFSRAAGTDSRQWNERVSRDFSEAVTGYTVIVLESVPKLFR